MRYEAFAKQVKCDGEHFADAASPANAIKIADALNFLEPIGEPFPGDIEPLPITNDRAHTIRTSTAGDYECSCGIRWDRDEGPDHP